MNKIDKIKSLTWRYFWQQKKEEALVPLMVTLVIGGMIGFCVFLNWLSKVNERLLNILGITIVFLFIISIIFIWIKLNWEKAKERAIKELK